MSATFVVYIDESGDEGFKFDKGSSVWFIVSAAVFRKEMELDQVKLIDKVRDTINANRQNGQRQIPNKKPLHFRDLKHDHRKFYACEVGKALMRTVSICICKPELLSPEKFQDNHRLYFYATRLLLERVSWLCRDNKRTNDVGDGSADLMFSNRSSMNYQNLQNYLERLRKDEKCRMDSTIVRADQLSTFSSGKRMGLQIADAVASSTYFALEKNSFGQTEDSYLRAMASRIYLHKGQAHGYGIKIIPDVAEQKRRRGEIDFPIA